MRALLLLLGGLAIAACSRPYEPPIVDESPYLYSAQGAAMEFPGLEDAFDGVEEGDDGIRRVRSFHVHGMCSGEWDLVGWMIPRLKQISATMRPGEKPDYDRRGDLEIKAGDQIEHFVYELNLGEGRVLETNFFKHGTMARAAEQALAYEHLEGEGAPTRATLNRILKRELLDKCMVDVLLYLGRSGDRIRRDMSATLCGALGGKPGKGGGAIGEPFACAFNRRLDQRPIVVMTESLGSKIMIDALSTLNAADKPAEGGGPEALFAPGEDADPTVQALGRIRQIHLISNQIPLLDLSGEWFGQMAAQAGPDATPEEMAAAVDCLPAAAAPAAAPAAAMPESARPLRRSPLGRALARITAGLAQMEGAQLAAKKEPAHVIAYTDPNDPFGYRVCHHPHFSGLTPEPKLTNVLVSNAPTYLGLLENPGKAHEDHAREGIFRMVARGSDGMKE